MLRLAFFNMQYAFDKIIQKDYFVCAVLSCVVSTQEQIQNLVIYKFADPLWGAIQQSILHSAKSIKYERKVEGLGKQVPRRHF